MDIEEVFSRALEIPIGAKRDEYLSRVCAGDSALRQRVESLLAAHEGAASFLETPANAMAPGSGLLAETTPPGEGSAPGGSFEPIAMASGSVDRPMSESPGTMIGRYKLLQQIGEGGMGVVYMAEQEKPVRRRVAVKIIKPGMDSAQVIARFEAERQALAMMDHPNIARVLDAGCTDTGRPYFVMELVQGIPITKYCDDKQLDTRARLELFIQVCNAVQHAHQKGIIHRDLKPSNVLVMIYDNKMIPKIIDFGVAKALHQRLTEMTMFTQFGAVVGTLEYMSPEQAEMDALGTDTRSDIYSLGVLLYELLTGSTPMDGKELRSLGYAEMLKTIREVDPPKPSTRLSRSAHDAASISAKRHTEMRRLQKLIAGDLDWIVMKCLEKDRTRRYETANGLATDIQRHLQDETVSASPPGQLYKLQKLVRRNKLVFGATMSVAVALLIGILASSWQAVRATRAQREALAAREQADAARNIEATLRVQAEADEKKAQTEGARSAAVARFMEDMLEGVGPSVALGRDTILLREILDTTAKRLDQLTAQPEVEAELRNTIGEVYLALGDPAKAEAMQRAALALQMKNSGDDNLDVATTEYDLARSLLERNNAESESLHRSALAIRRKVLGNESPVVAESLDNLARTLRSEGKFAEAESTQREALAIRRDLSGEESADVATSLHNLANLLSDQKKLAEAETMHREALAIRKRLFGDEQPDVASSLFDLARVLREEGKLAESESMQRESVAVRRKVLGNGHRRVADSLEELSRTLLEEKKFSEAEAAEHECLSIWEKMHYDGYSFFVARSQLGACLLAEKRYTEAEPLLVSGYEGLKKREATTPAQSKPRLKESLDRLVELYEETGRPEAAAKVMKGAGE